ncbi:MAG: hypothetical protein WCL00_07205 [Bacteroidota bacterium]
MKKIRLTLIAMGMMVSVASFMFTGCTKEGPAGPAGANGTNGTNGTNGIDGKDANETCKQCHTPAMVDRVAVEFQLSKHEWGTAAFEEAGNPGCDPCHTQKGYLYVVNNNTPTAFVFANGKWTNPYSADYANAIGSIGCWTCHSSLHTTYGAADTALTTTAAVQMTMWGGAKTIDLPAKGGMGNLCAKCHQPRPLTNGFDPAARLVNYDSLKNFPTALNYDSTAGAQNHGVKPSYRMHVHYGVVSAVYAGQGAVEFAPAGGLSYSNSPHTTVAACQDCHMATPMYGIAGGHAFNMRNAKESALGTGTTWNFAGCNQAGCHAAAPLDANSSKFKGTRTAVKTLLDQLATKINAAGGGHDLLNRNADGATNLWAGITTNNYDGYLNIYDAASNPTGYWKMSGQTQPKFPKLLNVQVGALINFQFCLREYSLGIHNTQYVTALLTNSIAALNAAGL